MEGTTLQVKTSSALTQAKDQMIRWEKKGSRTKEVIKGMKNIQNGEDET